MFVAPCNRCNLAVDSATHVEKALRNYISEGVVWAVFFVCACLEGVMQQRERGWDAIEAEEVDIKVDRYGCESEPTRST